jgi:hypothetical protein
MSGVEELMIRGFREPTMFSKGVKDSELVRYAGGALPVPAMRHEKWNSGTPIYEIVYCPRCVNRNLPKKAIVHWSIVDGQSCFSVGHCWTIVDTIYGFWLFRASVV